MRINGHCGGNNTIEIYNNDSFKFLSYKFIELTSHAYFSTSKYVLMYALDRFINIIFLTKQTKNKRKTAYIFN